MNKLNVQQTGGFPLETDTLEFTQAAYTIFNALGELAGPLSIVSGCEAVGSQITNGTVYINGELLEFRGAAIGTNVIIRQENTQRTFEDGNSKDVYQTRYAAFGTGTTTYPWADFKRISNLQELKAQAERLQSTVDVLKTKIVPIGAIMMWAGSFSDVPEGWRLCDGRFGTPNLQDRFIVGAGYKYAIGERGGQDRVKLTADQCAMPEHHHKMFVNEEGGNIGKPLSKSYVKVGARNHTNSQNYTLSRTDGEVSPALGKTSTEKGSALSSHENRPPYYALAFIQFKGN